MHVGLAKGDLARNHNTMRGFGDGIHEMACEAGRGSSETLGS